jgi:hypothetical protein
VNKLSFKTYLKFSVLRAVGEIMVYLGLAMAGPGIGISIFVPQVNLLLGGLMLVLAVAGTALIVSGYIIHKYGKFRENTEQIAIGVSKGIQNVPISQQVPPPPSNPCPECGRQLTFIDQYKAWYCFNCKEYK